MRAVRIALVVLLGGTLACAEPDRERPSADDDDESDAATFDPERDGEPMTFDASEAAPDADSRVDAEGRLPEAGNAPPSASDAGELDAARRNDAGPQRDARVTVRDAGDAASARTDGAAGARRDAAVDAGAASSSDAAASDAAVVCPARGNLTYSLTRVEGASSAQLAAYMRITRAMDSAIQKYNCYVDITRALRVSYDPSVATSDGSANGSIRFGSQASMTFVRAMHEISHALGVGSTEFRVQVQSGVFTGANATAAVRRLSGQPGAVVNSDGSHFWPYGLNEDSEYRGESDAFNHCTMVGAIRTDLGF